MRDPVPARLANHPDSFTEESGGGPRRGLLRLGRLSRVDWMDMRERNVFFAQWSIGASLTMAGWKIVAAVMATASLFWLANAAFSIGLAGAKILAVRAHRGQRARRGLTPEQWQRRMYRFAGAAMLTMAVVYIVSCLAMMREGGHLQRYDQNTGIAIAALTFTELGLAIAGLVSARRQSDLLVEVIKLSNLAGALTLLVLTQSALMSFSHVDGANPRIIGFTGVLFGTVTALMALYMLLRRFPETPDSGQDKHEGRGRVPALGAASIGQAERPTPSHKNSTDLLPKSGSH